jgi:hypothetical protein
MALPHPLQNLAFGGSANEQFGQAANESLEAEGAAASVCR